MFKKLSTWFMDAPVPDSDKKVASKSVVKGMNTEMNCHLNLLLPLDEAFEDDDDHTDENDSRKDDLEDGVIDLSYSKRKTGMQPQLLDVKEAFLPLTFL